MIQETSPSESDYFLAIKYSLQTNGVANELTKQGSSGFQYW